MKKKRTVIRALALIALLVVAVVVIAVLRIDAIARSAVQRGATDALGVPTTLRSADVGLLSGTFSLGGLGVSNPAGFTDDEPHFLTLGEGRVAVSLGTLRADVIELPHLRLSDLAVDIQRRRGESNYGMILANLQDHADPAGAPADDAGPGFVVREVTIRNIRVKVSAAPIGGEPAVIVLPIEKIALENVGSDEPLPLSALAGVIVRAVLTTAVEQGGALLPTDLVQDLSGSLASLGSLSELGVSVTADLGAEAEAMIQNAGAAAKHAAEDLKDTAEGAAKQLKDIGKGLLPGNKKNNKSGGG